MKFLNQGVIVTGASRGIGKAVAQRFFAHGAMLTILARDEQELIETAAGLKRDESNQNVVAIQADVSETSDIQRVVSLTIEQFGRIDILVNNAGVAVYKPVLEMTEAEWDLTLDVNLKGMFLFTKAVLPHMIRQNYGRIVNISSGLGRSGYPGLAAYSGSKFGVIGFTESVAEELRQHPNIKIFAVLPGGVNTAMHRGIFPEESPDRLLTPRQIADVVVSLAGAQVTEPSGTSIEVYS